MTLEEIRQFMKADIKAYNKYMTDDILKRKTNVDLINNLPIFEREFWLNKLEDKTVEAWENQRYKIMYSK
jgi:hypothetical protein